jgi:hypothetical protein
MPELQLIRWIDSVRHDDGWQSVEHYKRESERLMECETVGFVIHERADGINEDGFVMVAQSRMVGEEGSVTEVIQIPLLAIRERTPLTELNAKRARDA